MDLFPRDDQTVGVTIEEWREVVGFVRYEVSSMGRFRRKATLKFLSGSVAHNGYVHIGLMKDGHQTWNLAHRLVAATFLEQPTAAHCDVDHKNKVRHDNRLSNLEWVTKSQNMKRALNFDRERSHFAS